MLTFVLLLLALVAFFLAAISYAIPRVNPLGVGLALLTLVALLRLPWPPA